MQSGKNKYVNKIIDLYTQSQMEEPAKEEFHKWIVDDESFTEKEAALNHLWNTTENVVTQALFTSLITLQAKHQSLHLKKENRTFMFLKYAVAISLIIVVSTIFIFTNKTPTRNNIEEYFSEAGKSGIITLPDGSVIQTNSGSIILYPDSYGEETRTIYLSGEANFKVQKNADVPFIVKSKDFSVTALGTEFDVSSYPDDPCFKTTLISGSIKVQQNDESEGYILNENEQFVYTKNKKQRTISEVDIYEATAWQRGELVFRGAFIKDVLNVLERKYAVSFQYRSNVFNTDKYNFRFKKDASLTDIMDIIKEVSDDFDYKQVKDSCYINSRKMK